jgi:hypothetical protein
MTADIAFDSIYVGHQVSPHGATDAPEEQWKKSKRH